MTREQYLILCKAKRRVRETLKEERRLERINRDPDKQYEWDAWMTASGTACGLAQGLGWLESFIEAGNKTPPPVRRAASRRTPY